MLNNDGYLEVDGIKTGPCLKGTQGIQGPAGKDGHTPVITVGSDYYLYVDGKQTGPCLKIS